MFFLIRFFDFLKGQKYDFLVIENENLCMFAAPSLTNGVNRTSHSLWRW